MQVDCLIGSWQLIAYERQVASGKVTRPFGAHPRGYLIYTADGMMSVTLMPARGTTPGQQHDAIINPYSVLSWLTWRRLRRLVRFLLASTRYISYSGRYTVIERTVLHHVEVSHMPGLIHTDQERQCELRGNHLVLTDQRLGVCQRFIWKRVTADGAHGTMARQSGT